MCMHLMRVVEKLFQFEVGLNPVKAVFVKR